MIEISIHKKLKFQSGEKPLEINIILEEGSFTTLYGESGSGKTSILRMLSGLLEPERGLIKIDGSSWFDNSNRICLRPQQRSIGFVFQDYALFPNMTVRENLSYACPDKNDKQIIDELIEIIELDELQDRKPNCLSGGQQQRVALARALVQRPKLLLLDEPLSALDPEMRERLQNYILKAHKAYQLTTIMVSHNISEIIKMSDRVLVIEQGQVQKDGLPLEVFARRELSGKFKFVGEVVAIEKQDFIYILSILIGKDIVKVVANEQEVSDLKIGNQVLVASKAFNPIVQKIN